MVVYTNDSTVKDVNVAKMTTNVLICNKNGWRLKIMQEQIGISVQKSGVYVTPSKKHTFSVHFGGQV